MQKIAPIMKGTALAIIICAGVMIGGMMGSLVGADLPAGQGAILGSLSGGGIALMIGCVATGLWWQFMPDMSKEGILSGLSKAVPSALAPYVADHGYFTLILTIHKVQDVRVGNRLDMLHHRMDMLPQVPGVAPSLFAEIHCGSNPITSTCISGKRDDKGNPVFDEQFRLDITPQDNMFTIYLKDQTWFGSKLVARANIYIDNDITQPFEMKPVTDPAGETVRVKTPTTPFPQHKEKSLDGGERYTLTLIEGCPDPTIVLSFAQLSDDGVSGRNRVQANIQQPLGEEKWQNDYGAVKFLPNLQFNQTAKVNFDDVQAHAGLANAGANRDTAGIATQPTKNDSIYVNV